MNKAAIVTTCICIIILFVTWSAVSIQNSQFMPISDRFFEIGKLLFTAIGAGIVGSKLPKKGPE